MKMSVRTFLPVLLMIVPVHLRYEYNQQVGVTCILNSTGVEGTCKFIKDCAQARDGLNRTDIKIFPQPCGFQDSMPVVCCPNEREPGTVSKRKCREYAKYVNVTKKSPVQLINQPTLHKVDCGHEVIRLIIGGEKAKQKEFPHMAAVGYMNMYRDEIEWMCGGTLLSPRYVLTAAHCLISYEHGNASWVKLGVIDLNSSSGQLIKVASIIPHPEYRSSLYYHDIGLLKLEKNAEMNPSARPACLYTNSELSTERAIATGWGITENGTTSNELLKVTLDLFNHTFCNSLYQVHTSNRYAQGIIDRVHFCAGSLTRMNDTCEGDSGGPLQIYHAGDDVKCMYDIIGVTSFGFGCGGKPGLYTRVSNYVKWIEDIVWPK